jgi:hypothetical protein
MLGYTWKDFVSYAELLTLTAEIGVQILPFEIELRSTRLRYLGHVERMGVHRLPYIALHGNIAEGKRPKGAPKMTFRRTVQVDLHRFGLDKATWMEVAKNREEWRRQLRSGCKNDLMTWMNERFEASTKRHATLNSMNGTGARVSARRHKANQIETSMVFNAVDTVIQSNSGHIATERGRNEWRKPRQHSAPKITESHSSRRIREIRTMQQNDASQENMIYAMESF